MIRLLEAGGDSPKVQIMEAKNPSFLQFGSSPFPSRCSGFQVNNLELQV